MTPIVTAAVALQVVQQILTLVQESHDSGQPISEADFNAAVSARDSALTQLDRDINAHKHAMQSKGAAIADAVAAQTPGKSP